MKKKERKSKCATTSKKDKKKSKKTKGKSRRPLKNDRKEQESKKTSPKEIFNKISTQLIPLLTKNLHQSSLLEPPYLIDEAHFTESKNFLCYITTTYRVCIIENYTEPSLTKIRKAEIFTPEELSTFLKNSNYYSLRISSHEKYLLLTCSGKRIEEGIGFSHFFLNLKNPGKKLIFEKIGGHKNAAKDPAGNEIYCENADFMEKVLSVKKVKSSDRHLVIYGYSIKTKRLEPISALSDSDQMINNSRIRKIVNSGNRFFKIFLESTDRMGSDHLVDLYDKKGKKKLLRVAPTDFYKKKLMNMFLNQRYGKKQITQFPYKDNRDFGGEQAEDSPHNQAINPYYAVYRLCDIFEYETTYFKYNYRWRIAAPQKDFREELEILRTENYQQKLLLQIFQKERQFGRDGAEDNQGQDSYVRLEVIKYSPLSNRSSFMIFYDNKLILSYQSSITRDSSTRVMEGGFVVKILPEARILRVTRYRKNGNFEDYYLEYKAKGLRLERLRRLHVSQPAQKYIIFEFFETISKLLIFDFSGFKECINQEAISSGYTCCYPATINSEKQDASSSSVNPRNLFKSTKIEDFIYDKRSHRTECISDDLIIHFAVRNAQIFAKKLLPSKSKNSAITVNRCIELTNTDYKVPEIIYLRLIQPKTLLITPVNHKAAWELDYKEDLESTRFKKIDDFYELQSENQRIDYSSMIFMSVVDPEGNKTLMTTNFVSETSAVDGQFNFRLSSNPRFLDLDDYQKLVEIGGRNIDGVWQNFHPIGYNLILFYSDDQGRLTALVKPEEKSKGEKYRGRFFDISAGSNPQFDPNQISFDSSQVFLISSEDADQRIGTGPSQDYELFSAVDFNNFVGCPEVCDQERGAKGCLFSRNLKNSYELFVRKYSNVRGYSGENSEGGDIEGGGVSELKGLFVDLHRLQLPVLMNHIFLGFFEGLDKYDYMSVRRLLQGLF